MDCAVCEALMGALVVVMPLDAREHNRKTQHIRKTHQKDLALFAGTCYIMCVILNRKECAHITTATVRQIQHNLAGVLRTVEAGEEVEIRRRNRPIAKIVPIVPAMERAVDWAGLRAWRARMYPRGKVRGKPASALIYEGRGDR